MSIRMRHTRGHSGNRRSHHALKNQVLIKDAASGNLRLPHRLDEATGMYRGRQIAPAQEARAGKVKSAKGGSASGGKKARGANAEPVAPHTHDHTHDHANAEAKPASASKGFFGRFTTGGRPKARSGAGGGGV